MSRLIYIYNCKKKLDFNLILPILLICLTPIKANGVYQISHLRMTLGLIYLVTNNITTVVASYAANASFMK